MLQTDSKFSAKTHARTISPIQISLLRIVTNGLSSLWAHAFNQNLLMERFGSLNIQDEWKLILCTIFRASDMRGIAPPKLVVEEPS